MGWVLILALIFINSPIFIDIFTVIFIYFPVLYFITLVGKPQQLRILRDIEITKYADLTWSSRELFHLRFEQLKTMEHLGSNSLTEQ